jgi:hypothetical protein
MTRPGCLLLLAGPLMAFGIWLVAFAVMIRPESPTARVQIVIGAAAAVVGAALLAGRMRRLARAGHPQVELALPAGAVLYPAASVPLRIRQPGPTRFERLRVRLVCERRYTRQSMAPGSTVVSEVDEVEVVSEDDLLDLGSTSVTRRVPLERTVPLGVPGLGRPTGPTLPSGTIAWYLEVVTDTGRGPSLRDHFDLVVRLPGEDVTARAPDAHRQKPIAAAVPAIASWQAAIGCAAIVLGFLLTGPVFLYLYFSSAPTRRGNPVMGLVAGILFTALGLLGLAALVAGRRRR